jgi:hypothetical protein
VADIPQRREQKALHELCMRVKGEDARHLKREDVVVAYGEARFLSAMRGRPSVPVKRFRKHLKHYVTVVPTSERLTSQVCSKGCGSEGEKEEEGKKKKEKGDKLVAMRGGQHARTCKEASLNTVLICNQCRTVWNRDVNAARNIAWMFWWQRVHASLDSLPPRFRPRGGGDDAETSSVAEPPDGRCRSRRKPPSRLCG